MYLFILGTTSFFVNDYTIVDDNVTRHLDAELSTRDWDALFLHYLGLDHIGHTAGPHSHLVAPKLEVRGMRLHSLTHSRTHTRLHEKFSHGVFLIRKWTR